MLDFAKAFDLVPHRRLIHKIKSYGICEEICGWLEDFLKNRFQRVSINKIRSGWSPVLSGVPQGSVLGPLLFIIYINDLPDLARNSFKLYADDSKIISILNQTFSLQEDLDNVCSWSNTWLMRLNILKCKVLHYGKNNLKRTYYMTDSGGERFELEAVDSERDLGVIISSDLSWSTHINSIAGRANKILGMLKRTFISRDSELWKYLYTSLVRPHLEYAVQVWNPYLKKDILVLERIQRRATRIPHGFKELSYEERLKRWNLTSLEDRRIRGDLIEMYKIVNGIEKINWTNGLPFRADRNVLGAAQGTRGNDLKLEREVFSSQVRNRNARYIRFRENFFMERTIPHWNDLTSDVARSGSLNSFKNALDKKYSEKGRYGLPKQT
jgi:hypothetical protein